MMGISSLFHIGNRNDFSVQTVVVRWWSFISGAPLRIHRFYTRKRTPYPSNCISGLPLSLPFFYVSLPSTCMPPVPRLDGWRNPLALRPFNLHDHTDPSSSSTCTHTYMYAAHVSKHSFPSMQPAAELLSSCFHSYVDMFSLCFILHMRPTTLNNFVSLLKY